MAQQLSEQGQQQAAIPRRLGLWLIYYIQQLGYLPGAELFQRRLLQVQPGDLEIIEN